MFDFFKARTTEPDTIQAPHSTVLDSTRHQRSSHSDLVQLVLGELLQLHALPQAWLGYEVFELPAGAERTEVHIHLVIQRWDASLLRYAGALESQLRLGLDRFEPTVDHSRFVIAWRFAPQCAPAFPPIPETPPWSTQPRSAAPGH